MLRQLLNGVFSLVACLLLAHCSGSASVSLINHARFVADAESTMPFLPTQSSAGELRCGDKDLERFSMTVKEPSEDSSLTDYALTLIAGDEIEVGKVYELTPPYDSEPGIAVEDIKGQGYVILMGHFQRVPRNQSEAVESPANASAPDPSLLSATVTFQKVGFGSGDEVSATLSVSFSNGKKLVGTLSGRLKVTYQSKCPGVAL